MEPVRRFDETMGNRKEVIFPLELAVKVGELITAEDDVKIIETLRQALDAEMSVRAPRLQSDNEGRLLNQYAMIPDWRVRVLAAKIMAEMKHGRPKQSLDVKVSGGLNAPMSRAEAAKALLEDWDQVKRIGDEHVKLLKQAVPEAADAKPAQDAGAVLVDVDVPG